MAFNGDPSLLQLAQATPDLPTPQDLAETIEVQFTQEINDLAASLDNNPVKIYNWVRNNIDFVPTWGSIQGADHCLLTKACNAMDTASLLIALLRTSGISARYVMGTIKVPIDQVMNWAGGFTDKASALNFLSSGGIPITGIISGGEIASAQLEHTWVEAYIDYVPSRGAVHKNGDTWIPLDASFKQYDLKSGLDLQQITGFDGEAFLDQLQTGATINETNGSVTSLNEVTAQTELTNGRTLLNNFIATNPEIKTVNDIMGGKEIRVQVFPFFSSTLPYKVVVEADNASELADSLRHKMTVSLLDQMGIAQQFTVTKTIPEIAGRKLTLSYAPATSADEAVLLDVLESGANNVPAYLVKLIPQLRSDGTVIAAGPSVGMGQKQQLRLILNSPQVGVNQIINNTSAGTYSAIVLNLGFMPKQLDGIHQNAVEVKAALDSGNIEGLTKDDIMGEFLFAAGAAYWAQSELYNRLDARVENVGFSRLPSEGIFSYDINVSLLFNAPFSATIGGLSTDIDLDLKVVSSRNADQQNVIGFMSKTGMLASRLEASNYDLILNENFTGAGISTAHILEFANQQGIPIYQIDQNNINSILPTLSVSSEVKTDITNSVSAGRMVIIPEQEVTKDGWTGVGYLVLDTETGAGGYLISGGLAGGTFNCQCFSLTPMEELIIGLILIGLGTLGGPIGAAVGLAVASILIGTLNLLSAQCRIENSPDLNHPDLTNQKEMLLGFVTGFLYGSIFLAVIGIGFGGLGGFIAVSIFYLVMSIIATNLILNWAEEIARRRNEMANP